MFITILLWGALIVAGLCFLSFAAECRVRGTLASMLVIFLSITALNRNVASDICDAINQTGGNAVYVSGKCLIKNDGGFPVDKENSRLVYFNQ